MQTLGNGTYVSLLFLKCANLFSCFTWNWSEVCLPMDVTVCLPDLFEIDLKFVIVRQIYEPNSEDRKSREFNVTVMWFFCNPMHDLYEPNSEDRKSQFVWFKGDT